MEPDLTEKQQNDDIVRDAIDGCSFLRSLSIVKAIILILPRLAPGRCGAEAMKAQCQVIHGWTQTPWLAHHSQGPASLTCFISAAAVPSFEDTVEIVCVAYEASSSSALQAVQKSGEVGLREKSRLPPGSADANPRSGSIVLSGVILKCVLEFTHGLARENIMHRGPHPPK